MVLAAIARVIIIQSRLAIGEGIKNDAPIKSTTKRHDLSDFLIVTVHFYCSFRLDQ